MFALISLTAPLPMTKDPQHCCTLYIFQCVPVNRIGSGTTLSIGALNFSSTLVYPRCMRSPSFLKLTQQGELCSPVGEFHYHHLLEPAVINLVMVFICFS